MSRLMKELMKEEEKLFHCVHCGFCLPACPTYVRLWDEADSPRGRLHFMRALVEGRVEPGSAVLRRHLDRCLGCRACESVCPSGVEYGHLLEGAREATARASRPGFLSRVLPRVMAASGLRGPAMAAARALRASGFPAVSAQRLPPEGLLGQLRLGLGMIAATTPARVLEPPPSSATLKVENPGVRPEELLGAGARIGMLLGCVQEGLLRQVNRATARVLEANGFRLVEVSGQGCCGALHAHTGDLDGARRLARDNIRAFEAMDLDWIAVNAAGCGAMMKEYAHLLSDDPAYADKARALADKVRDVSELLGRRGLLKGGTLSLRITYDAPCHLLHAQRVAKDPLVLLDSIPGLERVPLKGADECCGGAGIYGITHPELGGEITKDKVAAVLRTGADVVATGNPGCLMQIGAGLRMAGSEVEVAHPVELLDESYRRGGLYA